MAAKKKEDAVQAMDKAKEKVVHRSWFDIRDDIVMTAREALDEETGEIKSEEALDRWNQLDIELEEKTEGIILYYKKLKYEAEALKTEKMALQKRQKVAENKVASLAKLIEKILCGEKFKTSRVAVSYIKSTSVEVDADAFLPEEYIVLKEEPNKTAIGEALKAGIEIEGARLIEKRNMQIK